MINDGNDTRPDTSGDGTGEDNSHLIPKTVRKAYTAHKKKWWIAAAFILIMALVFLAP